MTACTLAKLMHSVDPRNTLQRSHGILWLSVFNLGNLTQRSEAGCTPWRTAFLLAECFKSHMADGNL